ncbi:hypothetical protein PanWU01x14_044890 [Parasponia andersonii]|uniref:Uncharacterized protein n=1 Tax=Parasponia andersonii TaxID=3476 RepID=A0A2P5DPB8_PARAD|nr:hypothetical protein PanWU01x14_044890 [Parasponia andersonii]
MVPSEDEVPVAPGSDASRLPSGEMSATRAVYGEGMPLSLPEGSAVPTSSTPDSGSKSGTACLGREIAELSGGAPRLKSRLSSPPLVPIKRRHEVGSSKEEEARQRRGAGLPPRLTAMTTGPC